MSGLQRFEQRLEQMISGVFARTFRSAVQPVEISSALAREVDNAAQVLSRDRRLAPNDFTVELSEPDHERLTALGPALPDELVELLQQHAAAQSYVFTGPVGISFEIAPDLTTGRFRVSSQTMAKVTQSGPDISQTQVRRAVAVLEVNGETMPLDPPGLVVGRGAEADLRVNDPGVSRRHVEFRVTSDPEAEQALVVGLGQLDVEVVRHDPAVAAEDLRGVVDLAGERRGDLDRLHRAAEGAGEDAGDQLLELVLETLQGAHAGSSPPGSGRRTAIVAVGVGRSGAGWGRGRGVG